MKKITFVMLSLVLMTLLSFGCQPNESTDININQTSESELNNHFSINKDTIGISFSKPNGKSKVNFNDKETFHAFQEVFSSAVKEDGIVNMANPEFYMDIVNEENEQSRLYLWIGEKGERSTIMKPNDTNTIYTVSPEETDRLILLVENTFN
ncbi:hypothetical protein [Ornithinibacillus californiensis]|uniref:hypothetical protein n=1 Tax=Ornithinibacillus californiensis TaxID=161536 RepID=UPI00064DFFA8|nr:hypothetical protein [Ornithinibacillus californiensis]